MKQNENMNLNGQQTLLSNCMGEAIQQWLAVFYNRPPWAKPGASLTKFGAVVTAHVATLATSEISLAAGTGKRAEYIETQLERFLLGGLRSSLQLAATGGSTVLKPYVQGGSIYCDIVKPGDFTPTRIEGDTITACYFVDSATHLGKPYLRVETHSITPKGVRITNQVFAGNTPYKGQPLPLQTVPHWADLPPDIVIEGVEKPLYTVLKMPFANTVDPCSKLPVAIYANAMDTLKELDRIYNEFLWEIKSGRRKQIIDITAAKIKNAEDIRNGRDPQIATSDQYLVLDLGSAPQTPFSDYTPDMRISAYQTALNIQLRLLESQCGLSAETFGFDIRSGQARTATEVLSQDNSTYNTIKAIQEGGMRTALLDLIAIYDVYASLYRLAPRGRVTPSVDFGDSVFEDTGVEFTRRKALADDGYLKKEEMTAWYFGLSAEQARTLMPKQPEE
ncbi:hypothetical protein LJC61_03940 [Ruminococcaceae bacterium OttesenSCG-928-A16]|nr:hypothetical protein [Ruminococcaceae bacterium OttesenSCG-928-A16]